MLAAFEEAIRHTCAIRLPAAPEGIYTNWSISDGEGNVLASGTWTSPVGARGAEATQSLVDEMNMDLLEGAGEARIRVHIDPDTPAGTVWLID